MEPRATENGALLGLSTLQPWTRTSLDQPLRLSARGGVRQTTSCCALTAPCFGPSCNATSALVRIKLPCLEQRAKRCGTEGVKSKEETGESCGLLPFRTVKCSGSLRRGKLGTGFIAWGMLAAAFADASELAIAGPTEYRGETSRAGVWGRKSRCSPLLWVETELDRTGESGQLVFYIYEDGLILGFITAERTPLILAVANCHSYFPYRVQLFSSLSSCR